MSDLMMDLNVQPASVEAKTTERGTRNQFTINHESLHVERNRYMAEMKEKKLIMIGYSGHWDTTETMNKLNSGVLPHYPAYLISRSGKIYSLYPDSYWCNHTGVPAANERNPGFSLDNRSIGVLLCADINPGFESKGSLHIPWRGGEYFNRYPDIQHEAAAWLVRHLCKKHRIPAALLPKSKRSEYTPFGLKTFNGTCGYANLHVNGLYQGPGPTFDWDALELYLCGAAWYSELTGPVPSPES